ncbi:hypothetical protein DMN77_08010 [Paenibacillus sp. 79R4]|uniref:hypothetical protein n=1 Tax=Paenibacillus sp. 79R4 TaxID=2212847 RepID=UPI0015BECBDA|nr:hypothetical protein [Paenibacillus sp. 79R4]NWL87547.1 hypothetical protein [Paenibacillus sp. 79R4]
MKKFIAGFIVSALLFGAIPAFADGVKSIFGAKVTGIYTVQKPNGEKVAEGAVLNGSAYVPVRAMSEAVNRPLTVDSKKKVIILGDTSGSVSSSYDELNIKKNALLDKLKVAETAINEYETDVIPRAKDRVEGAINEVERDQKTEFLNERTKELEQYKSELGDLQKQLAEIDAKIAELEK